MGRYHFFQCISCNQVVYEGIFNSGTISILIKLVIPLVLVSVAGMYFHFYKEPSFSPPGKNKIIIKPVVIFSLFLGMGMGGFIDGILLHQILQWHQMISNLLPPDTLEAKNINMFWDGIFHTFTWILTLVGIILMWQVVKRKNVLFSNKVFVGGLIAGWGLFNLLDSVFNHYIFELHNVRENVPEIWTYNLGFLVFALLLLGIGFLLIRSGKKAGTTSIPGKP
jgi:uncharacterized membrane protein